MRQASTYLPTYAADNSAMCSALYELGGLLVMHDASGCNSTYTTHDEPRWYDHPADVFITALTEMDAVLGNEHRAIDDIVAAAASLHPRFISLAGTPIPMMMGCDYDGIAHEIEAKTGIVSFGVDTNGTDDYVSGVGKSFVKLAQRFVAPVDPSAPKEPKTVNILGVTPLDFSINGSNEAMEKLLTDAGFTVLSNWAMDSNATLEKISQAGQAAVNWVVTAGGLPVAQYLYENFGTPFVIGAPIGSFMSDVIVRKLAEAAETGTNINLAVDCRGNFTADGPCRIAVIGEAVTAAAIRASLVKDLGEHQAAVFTPLTAPSLLLGPHDRRDLSEDDFRELLPPCEEIIADPFYAHFLNTLPACAKHRPRCVDLPHEALSGRIWRDHMPVLVGERFISWYRERSERPSLL